MLFSAVKKILVGSSGKAFDSITEEMRHVRFSHPDEYTTLTWHGYSIKIKYDGSIVDFLQKLRNCYEHFDRKKYAAKLEKKKGIDHETAIETADEIYGRLGYCLNTLARSDALRKQKAHEQEEGGCIYVYWDSLLASVLPEHENPIVYFREGRYENEDGVQGYVYVPGKPPTTEEFNELFGNLNGRPLNEVMKFLKAFADITLTQYHETCDYEFMREIAEMTPEERERYDLEQETYYEVYVSEEGNERRENMSYDDWNTWLEDEVQRRVEEKLKAEEAEKKE